MNSNDSASQIDAVFKPFAQKMAEVGFEGRFAADSFKSVDRTLRRNLSVSGAKGDQGLPKVYGLWRAAPAMDLTKPDRFSIAISGQAGSDEALLELLLQNLNHQLRWLLVSAFESWERFVKDLYATCGYLDRSLWPASHLEHSRKARGFSHLRGVWLFLMQFLTKDAWRRADPPTIDLAWFKSRARDLARRNVKKIRSRLVNVLPDAKRFWTENSANQNCDLWIGAIEHMRHVIVHSHGSQPLEDFWRSVSKATGCSLCQGTRKQLQKQSAVARYIKRENGQAEVWLVKKRNVGTSYHGIVKPFEQLLENLSSCGALLYTSALKHFGELPLWEETR